MKLVAALLPLVASACAPSITAFGEASVRADTSADGHRALSVVLLGDGRECPTLDDGVQATLGAHTLAVDPGHKIGPSLGKDVIHTSLGDCAYPVLTTPIDDDEHGDGTLAIVDGDATWHIEIAHVFDRVLAQDLGVQRVTPPDDLLLPVPGGVNNVFLDDAATDDDVFARVVGNVIDVEAPSGLVHVGATSTAAVRACDGPKICESLVDVALR